MIRRLLLGYVLITLCVLAVHDVPLLLATAGAERQRLAAAVERDAAVLATYMEEDLEEGVSPKTVQTLQAAVETFRRRTGGSVVVTDAHGHCIIDSNRNTDTDTDTDHAGTAGTAGSEGEGPPLSRRPEIISALTGRASTGTASLGAWDHAIYAAVPIASAGTVYGAVRVAYPSTTGAAVRSRAIELGIVDALIVVAVATFGLIVAASITNPLRALGSAAACLARGDLTARAKTDRGPREVRQVGHTFNDMADRLSELVATQRTFVADASHQLRTPLTALALRLANVRGALTADPALAEGMDRALEETARFNRLVEGLLALARADGSRPQRRDVGVAAVLAGRAEQWDALAAERRVTITHEAPDELTARVAHNSLEQMLDNLIANALEVSPPGSRISLRGRCVHGAVWVEVADEGPGLADSDLERAFDRFWRGSGGGNGSGLGLSIVRQLARSSGGDADLVAGPTGGLIARVRLSGGEGSPDTATGAVGPGATAP